MNVNNRLSNIFARLHPIKVSLLEASTPICMGSYMSLYHFVWVCVNLLCEISKTTNYTLRLHTIQTLRLQTIQTPRLQTIQTHPGYKLYKHAHITNYSNTPQCLVRSVGTIMLHMMLYIALLRHEYSMYTKAKHLTKNILKCLLGRYCYTCNCTSSVLYKWYQLNMTANFDTNTTFTTKVGQQ